MEAHQKQERRNTAAMRVMMRCKASVHEERLTWPEAIEIIRLQDRMTTLVRSLS